MLDVTVVIAVYNAMPYLTETLDSVLEQDIGIDNLELIVVDDGSIDESFATLQAYSLKFPHMTIQSQANSGGPSQPRNWAIKRAQGRYVFILDADDYLEPETLRKMVTAADLNGTDTVTGKMKGLGGREVPEMAFIKSYQNADIFTAPLNRLLNPMKLYRTQFLHDNELLFPEHARIGEDRMFILETYFKSTGNTLLADQTYINYRHRNDAGNITMNVRDLENAMIVVRWVFDWIAERVPEGDRRDELMVRYFRREAMHAITSGVGRSAGEYGEECRVAFEYFQTVCSRYYTPRVQELLSPLERVPFYLVIQDRYDDWCEYASLLAEQQLYPACYIGGVRYTNMPWFNDPKRAIPVELFETSRTAHIQSYVTDYEIGSSKKKMNVQITSRIKLNVARPLRTLVFARNLKTGDEVILSKTRFSLLNDQGDFSSRLSGTVAIDPSLLNRQRPSDNLWTIMLRYTIGGVEYESYIHVPESVDIEQPLRFTTVKKNSAVKVVLRVSSARRRLVFHVKKRELD